MKFVTRKVFDCQDMPEDLRKIFFDMFENGNDSYVNWGIQDSIWDEGDSHGENVKLLDKWLVENGASPAPAEHTAGEEVLIKYWW